MKAPTAAQVDAMAEAVRDGWPQQQPSTPEGIVCLFVALHADLYGVSPAPELAGRAWAGAVARAAQLVERLGGYERTVDYLRWCWADESRRERWRREHGGYGRLDWRRVCSDAQVARWRASGPRTGAGPGAGGAR